MLVVHPTDITTTVLSNLYNGTESKVIDQLMSKRDIVHLQHHCPQRERIMLLGHGSNKELFSRTDDMIPEFNRIIRSFPCIPITSSWGEYYWDMVSCR